MGIDRSKPVNKYCKLANLRNESDVEQFLLVPLLKDLGFDADYLETKSTIQEMSIGKGKKKKHYVPDYLAYTSRSRSKPVLVIDAKHPTEDAEAGVLDAQLYASVIRRRLAEPKPEQYCIGANGHRLLVNSPLKKASLTGFHATAKHIAAKAVSPSSETMRTI